MYETADGTIRLVLAKVVERNVTEGGLASFVRDETGATWQLGPGESARCASERLERRFGLAEVPGSGDLPPAAAQGYLALVPEPAAADAAGAPEEGVEGLALWLPTESYPDDARALAETRRRLRARTARAERMMRRGESGRRRLGARG